MLAGNAQGAPGQVNAAPQGRGANKRTRDDTEVFDVGALINRAEVAIQAAAR